jgi:hypothetical protein
VTGLTTLAAFAFALRRSGGDLVLARSVGFATLVGQQLLQIGVEALAGRDAASAGEGRRVLTGALLASFAFLGASLHLPLMQRLFFLTSPGREGWSLAAGASLAGALTLAAGIPGLRGAAGDPTGAGRRPMDSPPASLEAQRTLRRTQRTFSVLSSEAGVSSAASG